MLEEMQKAASFEAAFVFLLRVSSCQFSSFQLLAVFVFALLPLEQVAQGG